MVANAGVAIVKPLVDRKISISCPSSSKGHLIYLFKSPLRRNSTKSYLSTSEGVMLCYKYAAIQMIKQGGGGRIIGKYRSAVK